MRDAQVEQVLDAARAFAAAESATAEQARIISGLSFCTLARLTYHVLSEYAEEAPFTYAWAIRTVAGRLRKWSAGRCK